MGKVNTHTHTREGSLLYLKPKIHLHRNIQNGISLNIWILWPSHVNVKLKNIVPQSVFAGAVPFVRNAHFVGSSKQGSHNPPVSAQCPWPGHTHTYQPSQVPCSILALPLSFPHSFLRPPKHPIHCKACFILPVPG